MACENGSVVVIAMDGSEHSNYALKYYAHHVHKPDNKVKLVHCGQYASFNYGSVSMMPGNPGLVEKIINEEEHRIQKLITSLEKLLVEYGITNGEVIRIYGEIGHEVLEKAKSLNADLIVTGARGAGTVRRTLMGSVSDYLVHHSHKPVLVCKHPDFHNHHGHHNQHK